MPPALSQSEGICSNDSLHVTEGSYVQSARFFQLQHVIRVTFAYNSVNSSLSV